jgi:hypothetical protein
VSDSSFPVPELEVTGDAWLVLGLEEAEEAAFIDEEFFGGGDGADGELELDEGAAEEVHLVFWEGAEVVISFEVEGEFAAGEELGEVGVGWRLGEVGDVEVGIGIGDAGAIGAPEGEAAGSLCGDGCLWGGLGGIDLHGGVDEGEGGAREAEAGRVSQDDFNEVIVVVLSKF